MDLRGWLPLVGVELTEEQIGRVLDLARVDLRAFEAADGTARFGLSAHVVTARSG